MDAKPVRVVNRDECHWFFSYSCISATASQIKKPGRMIKARIKALHVTKQRILTKQRGIVLCIYGTFFLFLLISIPTTQNEIQKKKDKWASCVTST